MHSACTSRNVFSSDLIAHVCLLSELWSLVYRRGQAQSDVEQMLARNAASRGEGARNEACQQARGRNDMAAA